MKKRFRRPDEAAMRRVMERVNGELAEIILLLAWEAGLGREEIQKLRWTEVSFLEKMLVLPERSIPIDDALFKCLESRHYYRGRFSEFVVHGDRHRLPLQPQSISRVARVALDTEDCLKDITLTDLRHDYVIRMLSKHDWRYVAKISGMAVTTMTSIFPEYLETNQPKKPPDWKPDEFFIWKLVQNEGASPEGLAIWMAWKHSMEVNEIIGLTWADVDFSAGTIRLPERVINMDAMLKRRLESVLSDRTPEDDPHVLLTPKSRRPYEHARLSNATRTVFIRNGDETLTLRDLIQGSKRSNRENEVFRLIETNAPITREDVMTELGVSESIAYHLLRRLADAGEIIRIGRKYYPADRVIPPEEHYKIIWNYLEKTQSAYRQEFAEILGIEPAQCGHLLRQLVKEGKLFQSGQRYSLPEDSE